MARADRTGERVTASLFHEFFGFGRIGKTSVALVDFDVLFDAAEHSEFSFNGYALGVGSIHHALGDRDVFGEGVVRRVDHHRAEKAGIDAVVTSLLVTVVEMDGKDHVGENLRRGANHRFEHTLVGVAARAFGNLDDERRLRFHAAPEETHRLLSVVDVIGTDGVFAVGVFKQLSGGNDHRGAVWPRARRDWKAATSLFPQGGARARFRCQFGGGRCLLGWSGLASRRWFESGPDLAR